MKKRLTFLALLLVFCGVLLTACSTEPARPSEPAELPQAEPSAQNNTPEADELAVSAALTKYQNTEAHKFTSATIDNYGADTLSVAIGTYSAEIAPGKGITLTYKTYAIRTISLSSSQELDYTVSYD